MNINLLNFAQKYGFESTEDFIRTNSVYTTGSNKSIVQTPYPSTEDNSCYSGMIFNSTTFEVLAIGVSSPVTYYKEIAERTSMVMCKVHLANLGSIVHLWYHDNEWHVSTKTHVDAKYVNWHDINLGEKCLSSVVPTNTDYCYTIFIPDYLVQSNVDIQHVGTVNMKTGEEIPLTDHSIDLPIPKWIHLKDWDELNEYVDELPISCPGVLIKDIEKSIQYFKKNEKFEEIEKLLGNNRDLEYRCIVLNHLGKRNIAETLFPILTKKFKEIDTLILKIAKFIHRLYIKRFIQKNKLVCHPEIHTVMQHVHKEYLERRRSGINRKVTLKIVLSRIWIYSPKAIAKHLRLLRTEKETFFWEDEFNEENLKKQALLGPKRKKKY